MNENTKHKTLKEVIRAAAFIGVFFILLNMLSVAFVPKYKNDETGMVGYITKSYNGEKENSIDAFFVGNSDVYRSVSPMRIWGEAGVSSCVSGKGNQTPRGAYSILYDMYKKQSPKVVFIETDMLYKLGSGQSGFSSLTTAVKRAGSFVKTRFTDFDSAAVSGIGYYFPILKYHDRWNKLSKSDFVNTKASYDFENNGFISDFTVEGYNGGFSYMGSETDAPEAMSKSAVFFLNKMINLCEKNGSKVVLLEVPSAVSWDYGRHNAVKEFADKHGIDFIDMNVSGTVNGFDWTKDTKDGGDHLNTYGAEKVTKYIAAYLNENTELTNRRNDPDFVSWNETYLKYSESIRTETTL